MSLACLGVAFCPLNTLVRPRLDCTFTGSRFWFKISMKFNVVKRS